jgi:hypothetical protein
MCYVMSSRRILGAPPQPDALRVAKPPLDLGWPHACQVLSLKRYVVAKSSGEVIRLWRGRRITATRE